MYKRQELGAIRVELTEQGYLQAVAEKTAKRKRPKAKGEVALLSFTVHDYTVIVGRNNKENDLITMKISRPDDIWTVSYTHLDVYKRQPKAKAIVTTAGRPSGIAATARLTPDIIISMRSPPRKKPAIATKAHRVMLTATRMRPKCSSLCCSGCLLYTSRCV